MDGLVVIDVQMGMFALPEYPPHDGEAVVARIADLIARARGAGVPIFFVQHDGGAGDILARGTAGFPFRPELAPKPGDDVTVKTQCNAFQNTHLEEKLRAANVERLVICGMQTEYCVDTAVRAASDRGFQIILVRDAHSTGDTRALKAKDIVAHHNLTLRSFAEITPADSVSFCA